MFCNLRKAEVDLRSAVDVASGTIKDNIMTLPYKEPSQVLYSLLGTIVEEGRRFASAADLKVSDMSAQVDYKALWPTR